MAPADLALIAPHLEAVTCDRGEVLILPGKSIQCAWFLTSGLSSVIAMSTEVQGIEVGLAGRDGLIGTSLVLDSDRSPHRVFMQVDGGGFRIEAQVLRDLMDQSRTLQKLLLRYVQAFSVQQAYTALSNTLHTIEERLARWLLMSHDRQDGDDIALTHDFMSLMLGVRRPSVTIALHSLEGLGFIRSTRGMVVIRSRSGLEEFASGAYGTPEAEYERLIGVPR
jgi:CRP-like cAMP-binding protein